MKVRSLTRAADNEGSMDAMMRSQPNIGAKSFYKRKLESIE